MKYFLIAGERSGDLYGGNLIRSLKLKDPLAQIACYGGDEMQLAGAELLSHYKESAFMGFFEVLMNLRMIGLRLKQCKSDILAFDPDVLIFIDYPGFNLRMAAFAKSRGYQTAYYISQKLWAWKKNRIHKIRKYVDLLMVIFPFEVPFFKSMNHHVVYVGNPLVEHIASYQLDPSFIRNQNYQWNISFLPGSRKQEVLASVGMISKLSRLRDDVFIWVAGVDNLSIELYAELGDLKNVKVVIGKTYELLNLCDAAVVTSGTATLETALWGVPQLVCYKTHPISYSIAKRVVNVKFISLVNLIAEKEVVKELLQGQYTLLNVAQELQKLLENQAYRNTQIDEYQALRGLLGPSNTSELVANNVFELSVKQPLD